MQGLAGGRLCLALPGLLPDQVTGPRPFRASAVRGLGQMTLEVPSSWTGL